MNDLRGAAMTFEGSDGHENGRAGDLRLNAAQAEFLVEAARKIHYTSLNRPFVLVGEAPQRRLERQGVVINTAVSDQDLLTLARAGYLDYRSQDRTVLFRDQLNGLQISKFIVTGKAKKELHVRAWRDHIQFGKHPFLTALRLFLLFSAGVLAVLYALAGASGIAVQTWAAIGGLLVATLALGYPQRDR